MKVTHVDHSINQQFTVELNGRFYIEVEADVYPNNRNTYLDVDILHGINEQGEKYTINPKHVKMFKDAIYSYVNENSELFGYQLNIEPNYEPMPITI